MIPLFKDLENIFKVDTIALQEPRRKQRNLTTYHLLKQNFRLIYLLSIEIKVCFYVRKGIFLSLWTYTYHFTDYTTLYLLTVNYQKIYVYNIYYQIKRSNALFSILKKLEKILLEYIKNKNKYLILRDFNLHHLAWGGKNSTTVDPGVEDLIFLILFNNLSQIIPEKTITYKKKNKKSIIKPIFSLPLLAKRMQICDTQTTFDHNSDPLSILSQQTLHVMDVIPKA